MKGLGRRTCKPFPSPMHLRALKQRLQSLGLGFRGFLESSYSLNAYSFHVAPKVSKRKNIDARRSNSVPNPKTEAETLSLPRGSHVVPISRA